MIVYLNNISIQLTSPKHYNNNCTDINSFNSYNKPMIQVLLFPPLCMVKPRIESLKNLLSFQWSESGKATIQILKSPSRLSLWTTLLGRFSNNPFPEGVMTFYLLAAQFTCMGCIVPCISFIKGMINSENLPSVVALGHYCLNFYFSVQFMTT